MLAFTNYVFYMVTENSGLEANLIVVTSYILTAGLALHLVRGNRRVPAPPPSITATTVEGFLLSRSTSSNYKKNQELIWLVETHMELKGLQEGNNQILTYENATSSKKAQLLIAA